MKLSSFVISAALVILPSLHAHAAINSNEPMKLGRMRANDVVRIGMHYPNGDGAMDYAYKSLFKRFDGLTISWGYYEHCAKEYPGIPVNKQNLINAAIKVGEYHVAPDATCQILGLNQSGASITPHTFPAKGSAFIENAGVNGEGRQIHRTFNVMWFDDNWLARVGALAYNRPLPVGLYAPKSTRWHALDGGTAFFNYYPDSDYVDQVALNGLRAIALNDSVAANKYWQSLKALTTPTYDTKNQRYVFYSVDRSKPGRIQVHETYHLALVKLFADRMMVVSSGNTALANEAYQYSRSLLSLLKEAQKVNPSLGYLGFASDFFEPTSLINTETTLLSAMALGSGADWSFEPGVSPMRSFNQGNYFLRPHGVLSAVKDISTAGHMVFGPYLKFPVGTYQAIFNLRVPHHVPSEDIILSLSVYDETQKKELANRHIKLSEMNRNNEFTRIAVNFSHTLKDSRLEFRVYWHNRINADVGTTQIIYKGK